MRIKFDFVIFSYYLEAAIYTKPLIYLFAFSLSCNLLPYRRFRKVFIDSNCGKALYRCWEAFIRNRPALQSKKYNVSHYVSFCLLDFLVSKFCFVAEILSVEEKIIVNKLNFEEYFYLLSFLKANPQNLKNLSVDNKITTVPFCRIYLYFYVLVDTLALHIMNINCL